ncbi:MAG: hypothetical protein AAFV53_25755 [Myxococcota bacterium]
MKTILFPTALILSLVGCDTFIDNLSEGIDEIELETPSGGTHTDSTDTDSTDSTDSTDTDSTDTDSTDTDSTDTDSTDSTDGGQSAPEVIDAVEAHVVDGAFIQLTATTWVENRADLSRGYTESHRDAGSVYLTSDDGAPMQLDFHRMEAIQGENVLDEMRATPERTSGWSASRVVYRDGAFVQISPDVWIEENPRSSHIFTEIGRDPWSVYLYSEARSLRIQLDLWTGEIWLDEVGGGEYVLYTIDDTVLNGWSVREVETPTTRFTQIDLGRWQATDDSGMTTAFVEYARDRAAVFLVGAETDLRVQLDLSADIVRWDGETLREDMTVIR